MIGSIVGATLFVGGVLIYVPYMLGGWRIAPPFFGWEPFRWIGVVLILAAAPLLLDFLVRFVSEGHGTPVPIAPPQRLVVRGAFRYVRNPAYVGAVAALIGQALWLGSRDVLIYALAMALGFHLFVVFYEEPTLRRKFGADYEAYRREVPRWIPRIARR